MSIAENISILREKIEKTRKGNPLAAARVILLAASKGQTAEAIEEAIAAGITDFGENRVQEAEAKWPEIKKRHPEVRLHLIGPLQTNKAKEALQLFDVIQTVDRLKLVEAIARIAEHVPHSPLPTTRFLLQLNTGEEAQKAGVSPQETDALIEGCRKLGLAVTGLMCIPPAGQPPAPHFALLRQIAEKHDLKELSMGMSGDFETAVRMGATCVRVGTAIFGKRK